MNPRILQIIIVILAVGVLGYGGFQAYKVAVKPALAPKPTPKPVTLLDYAGSQTASVRFTTKGPVTAPEKHVEQSITISQSGRQLEVTRGYNGSVEHSESFGNDPAAFDDFMRALQNNEFLQTTKGPASEVGQCSNGTRYLYELIDNNNVVKRSWWSTCGVGTFNGTPATIRMLFQNQIPDYSKLPSNLHT